MSATGRPEEHAPAASEVAASCRDAGFVRLLAGAGGDALAATGVLAKALADAGVPFQASLDASAANPDGTTDADYRIAIQGADADADHAIDDAPASRRAFAVASELGEADPVLALAGTLAADAPAAGDVLEAATAAGIERRPGVAVPTADLADGLAHSTLVHGPFSGDPDRVADAFEGLDQPAELDDEARRRVASWAALAVGGDAEAPPRAAETVERVLRPHAGGPLATVGGYADVLDALAQDAPGIGLGFALGRVETETALDAWRDHARRAHGAVREATTRRHDGLLAADVDGPARTVGRLLRDFRSPEPTVLVHGSEAVVLTTRADGVDARTALATALDGLETAESGVFGTAGTARARPDETDGLEAAVRGAL